MTNGNDQAAITMAGGGRRGILGRRLIRVAVFFCLTAMLSGCGPKIYHVNMRYEPTKAIPAAVTDGKKFSVTVAAFVDQRKMEDTLLVGRVIKSGGTAIPILPRYTKPVDAVTAALRDVLGKAGYPVAPGRPAWDLSEAAIRPEWGTILVGGTIDALDVTCVKAFTMNRYNATARVTLIFADVAKKRIFYRLTSESSSSLEHPFLSEARLEGQINSVLSDAIEKAVEGPETARQIREALKP